MSVIQRLTEWFLAREEPFTLELGSRWIRVGRGRATERPWRLERWGSAPSPRGLLFNSRLATAVFDETALLEAVRAAFGGRLPPQPYVSLILPDQAFHLGTVLLSTVAVRTGALAFIEREIQNVAPLPLREYRIAFEVGVQIGAKSQVHFAALPRGILHELEEFCQRLGIIPLAIQPTFPRLLWLLRQVDRESSPYPSVLLHLGHEATTVAVYSQTGLKRLQCLPFGGCDLDRALATLPDRDPAPVEAFKQNGILLLEDPASEAQNEVEAYRVVEPLFVNLLQKLYAILQAHAAEVPNEGCFRRIILSGGTACLRHLDKLIHANLGIPVVALGTLFEMAGPTGPLGVAEKTQWAPIVGDFLLQPWKLDRLDRLAAA